MVRRKTHASHCSGFHIIHSLFYRSKFTANEDFVFLPLFFFIDFYECIPPFTKQCLHISRGYTPVCSSRWTAAGYKSSQRKTTVLAAALVDDCSLLTLSSTLHLEVRVWFIKLILNIKKKLAILFLLLLFIVGDFYDYNRKTYRDS